MIQLNIVRITMLKLHIVLMGDLIHGTIHVSARLHQNEVVTNQVLIVLK